MTIVNTDADLVAELVIDLSNDEGIRLQVYDDATGRNVVPGYTLRGHPTIGRGRALDVKGISNDESLILLHNDINGLLVWCEQNMSFFASLNSVRQRVVINMCFQMGEGGFLGFKELISCLEKQDWEGAKNAMLNSSWAKETPERANTLATWMESGVAS